MKQQKSHNIHNLLKIAGVLLFLVVAFIIKTMLEEKEVQKEVKELPEERTVEYAESVDKDHAIAQVFFEKYPDAELLVACEEDVTNDGNQDLVVIYKKDGHVRMVVVMDEGNQETYSFSEPIPAPVENQKIQFKNIDKEAEMEIIITGEKKGAVGYAIYRIVDGQPVDLFGEGMEDCC